VATLDERGRNPFARRVSRSDGTADKVYVTSQRDGQVIALGVADPPSKKVIALGGKPTKMLMSASALRLYVVNPDLDEIDEIDTVTDTLTRRISVQRPGHPYRGANLVHRAT
jgi:DNA-binding beta-propeller fold protein YncE